MTAQATLSNPVSHMLRNEAHDSLSSHAQSMCEGANEIDRLERALTAAEQRERESEQIICEHLAEVARLKAANADLNNSVMTLGQQGTARELYIAKLREELKRERAKR